MQSRDFCFWLQGFFELGHTDHITAEQATAIRRHLDMVFVHEIGPSLRERPAAPIPEPVVPVLPEPTPRPMREKPNDPEPPYPSPEPPRC